MAGSLRERGKGTYELRVYAGLDPVTGRQRYATKTFRGGLRAAKTELAKFTTKVEEEGDAAHNPGTVGDLLERWYEVRQGRWSPTTRYSYRAIIDKRLKPRFGRTRLDKLRVADLDAWYAELHESGGQKGKKLSPASVHRIHTCLKAALNQGMRWGLITRNPAALATPPRELRADTAIPTIDDVLKLLAVAGNSRNKWLKTFVRMALVTGARRGELVALRWGDVDLGSGDVHIHRSLVQVGGEVLEKSTKTHAARHIRVDTDTLDELQSLHDKQVYAAKLGEAAVGPEQYVFSPDPCGREPWHPNSATQAFRRLSEQAGVDVSRLHSARHFAATTMLATGTDIRTVSGRLGHRDAATTLNVYSHFLSDADADAADRLAAAITRRPSREKRPRPD
jgi:integrase